mmetsp:Transcript_4460/g.11246  ORF Transcript_4460/g.11246 Transcript_4460/m.11246 type:complete len:261 (+) Transcript_4460:1048-1830(+)
MSQHGREMFEVTQLVERLHQGLVLGVGDVPVVGALRRELVLAGAAEVELEVGLEHSLAVEELQGFSAADGEVQGARHVLGGLRSEVLGGALGREDGLHVPALGVLAEDVARVVALLVGEAPASEVDGICAHVLDADLLPLPGARVRVDHEVGQGDAGLLVAVDLLLDGLHDGGVVAFADRVEGGLVGRIVGVAEPGGQARVRVDRVGGRVLRPCRAGGQGQQHRQGEERASSSTLHPHPSSSSSRTLNDSQHSHSEQSNT